MTGAGAREIGNFPLDPKVLQITIAFEQLPQIAGKFGDGPGRKLEKRWLAHGADFLNSGSDGQGNEKQARQIGYSASSSLSTMRLFQEGGFFATIDAT